MAESPPIQALRLVKASAFALETLSAEVAKLIGTVVGQQDATESLFVPLGQAVMWLAALDDFLWMADRNYPPARDADPQGNVLLGQRLVRNALLHGDLVVELARADAGAVLGRMRLGASRLGSGPSCDWVTLEALRLRQAPRENQAVSYRKHFSQKPIMKPLLDGFAFLQRSAGVQ